MQTSTQFKPCPYWETLEKFTLSKTEKQKKIIDTILEKGVPLPPKTLSQLLFKSITVERHYMFRGIQGLEFLQDKSINKETKFLYGNSLPGPNAVPLIENFLSSHLLSKKEITIIDYGAEMALWSRLFVENGFRVKAVDCLETIQPWMRKTGWTFLTDVSQHVEFIAKDGCALPLDCSKVVLFISWPENPHATTQNPPYAERILQEFRNRKGEIAIYVGQKIGGITACDEFFDEIANYWNATVLNSTSGAVQTLPCYQDIETLWLLKKKTATSPTPYLICAICVALVACLLFSYEST
jgi:hypothetical protein